MKLSTCEVNCVLVPDGSGVSKKALIPNSFFGLITGNAPLVHFASNLKFADQPAVF